MATSRPGIDCEALTFLRQPVAPRPGLRVYQLPATTVAAVFCPATDEATLEAHRAVEEWIAANALKRCGPQREIYWRERVDGRTPIPD